MALQKTIMAEKNLLNIEVKDAYIKITDIRIDSFGVCSITVKIYKDRATSKDNTKEAIIIKTFNFIFDKMSVKNAFTLAYEHLKTVEDFNNSVDV